MNRLRPLWLYFLLPPHVYGRFQGHLWNRQSALLQEVKNVLSDTYPNTDMSGDGQVEEEKLSSRPITAKPTPSRSCRGTYNASSTVGEFPDRIDQQHSGDEKRLVLKSRCMQLVLRSKKASSLVAALR